MATPFEEAVGMSSEDFYSDYWGKKPLFVKGAVPAAAGLITPEDLAGLSCENAASRLVKRDNTLGWDVQYGPFEESTFAALGEENWTLLVQEVERWDRSVNTLLETFRAFPNWRLDDVMVSYAVPGGTVGAHVDQYDVFLVQGAGSRRWEIGLYPLRDPDFVEGLDLRILSDFSPGRVIEAEPGDLLYLPPMFAHHGVAITECLTLSVGFRKPLVSDMVASYLSEMLTRIDPERQLSHSITKAVSDPGLLDFNTLESIRSVFRSICYDEESIDEWYGRFITSPSRTDGLQVGETWEVKEVRDYLEAGGVLARSAQSLCSYQERPGGSVRLFVAGDTDLLPSGIAPIARLICGAEPIGAETLGEFTSNEHVVLLLTDLVNRGFLLPDHA
ncbi:MAG: cupin domain-containing protein [Rhodothermales bacterium]|nr:cupin domain-containing protein [Rhodothermales bacterium]